MASRTSEEILAQRDAWLARKAARDAGEDIPMMPPLKPGEQPPEPTAQTSSPEPTPEPQAEPASSPEPVAVQATATPAPSPPAAPQKVGPQKPSRKRTPEEIQAQRDAWLARKTAKEAGQEVSVPVAEAVPAAAPTPVVAKPTAEPKPKPKPTAAKFKSTAKKPEPEPELIDPVVSRRELLNYAWLASIALFSVQAVGFTLWFAFPNFKAGQFGGAFPVGQANEVLPEVNSGPVPYTDGKFWLINVDTEFNGQPRQGVLAIYKVCTHLGCLYEWIPITGRFECPCHGSKFALTGDYLAGPARRSLDRFVVQALAPDGSVRAQTDPAGDPLVVNDDDLLIVDTGQRILGSAVT